jgi:hypothetical protein
MLGGGLQHTAEMNGDEHQARAYTRNTSLARSPRRRNREHRGRSKRSRAPRRPLGMKTGEASKEKHAIDRRFAPHETPPVLVLVDPFGAATQRRVAEALDRSTPYTVIGLEQDSSHTQKLRRSLGFQFRRSRRLEGLHKSLGTVVHGTAPIRVQSIPRPTGRCTLHTQFSGGSRAARGPTFGRSRQRVSE